MHAVIEYQDTEIFSPDERLQRAIGPFQTFDAAQSYADKMQAAQDANPDDIPLVYSVVSFDNPEGV